MNQCRKAAYERVSDMEYRNMGKTGLKVSELSLGSYMTYGQRCDMEATKACIDAAFDCGINSFDTADVYGKHYGTTGSAEEVMGKVLREHSRSSYVLATKVGYGVFDGENGKGLSRKHLFEACDASLKRLGMDYIDVYYMHLYDDTTPVEETMDALEDLVRQGKVLYTGISNWNTKQIDTALKEAHSRQAAPKVVQPPYNMFDRRIEGDILPLCGQKGLGMAVYFPLAQGVLAGRYNSVSAIPQDSRAADGPAGKVIEYVGVLSQTNIDKVRRMTAIARESGLEMAQLALAWILRKQEISTILVGASKPEQIRSNSAASGVSLQQDVVEAVERILNE